jgi:predicted alpha/beta-fold hydrolase
VKSFDVPQFRDRSPWWGPDLQTLRNVLRGPIAQISAAEQRRVLLPMADDTGDALACELAFPNPASSRSGQPPRALVVLIHGLSGSAESAYMLTSASHWLARGHAVLRLSLRGAGASREHCRLQYHAGRTQDLRDVLNALEPDLSRDGLVLVGYSLGGNMLLKFLAEHGADFPIQAAMSVSAPIDLSAASQRFLARRNLPYHRHLLATMKLESFGGRSELSERERQAVHGCRTIYEFDEYFVAPRNGYRNAEHYYAENHARLFLGDIRVPTLLVQALNDPWIPAESYTTVPWDDYPALHPLLAPSGGHVGFHGAGDHLPWHDRCAAIFVDAQTRAGA